jgi:ketosteroid isomerase-like protein
MDLEALAARITRLEDLEAIKQLKARYCEICDDDHDPDRITAIFTEDGVWEGKGIGRAEGHDEIRALFTRFQSAIRFSQHMTMNPIIEVEGETARGTWYFFGPFTITSEESGNQALWQACRYHETYRKVDGRWLISSLSIRGPRMAADYETGWAR